VVIYIKPIREPLTDRESELVGLIMQHKKKTVRNAILDSRSKLGIDRNELAGIAERVSHSGQRVFKLAPAEIFGVAKELESLLE